MAPNPDKMTPMVLSPVLIQFLLGGALLAPSSPAQRLQNLLSDLLIIDTHIDTANCIVDEGYQLAEEHSYYQTDIPRLRRGRVVAVFFGVWVEQEFPPQLWVTRTLDLIDALQEQVRRNSQDLEMASTADDIVRLHRTGKVAALLGLEGGQLISDSLPVLRDYYRLGVRYMTLTHTANTDWADSSAGKPQANGLTEFGRAVVARMNRLGMMVDLSHVSDQTFYAALAASKAPVIASHSSCRALCNAPRNMTDEMIRALARNGGVIQINFFSAFLDPDYASALKKVQPQIDAAVAAERAAFARKGRQLPWTEEQKIGRRISAGIPAPPLERVADHIDHAVQVGGVDHVGIGSDFDGIESAPERLEDVSKLPALVKELARRGYSEDDLIKILGGNLLRVMRQVEDTAGRMRNN